MRCGGRYICGCGADYCWWAAFGMQWWLISFEMAEKSSLYNARRDDYEWNERVRRVARTNAISR